MKRLPILLLLQAVLSAIAGYLISKMSLLGRVGINLAYKEYAVLKSPVKAGLLLLLIQFIIIGVLWVAARKLPARSAKGIAVLLLLVGFAGLYVTYDDFQRTVTHRLLKEKFHLGFYLFWAGWIMSCTFFLTTIQPRKQYAAAGER